MRVLMLVQAEQRTVFSHLYNSIGAHCQLDLRRLSAEEQADLRQYFENIDTSLYDRIICFLRFKKEIRQVAFIRRIPNLVIFEMDAWQNYYSGSKYKGKFSRHYRAVPWARILVSGYSLSQKLIEEGFDARFVSKGYDDSVLRNLNKARDIEFAFVGSLKNKLYVQRKAMLEAAQQRFNLLITRTASGQEYLETLNRVKFFMSCDHGFGEYMLKNYEAMACGCVLFAWDQGEQENKALGFQDMKNVVLYKSLDEVELKLNQLRADNQLSQQIANSGQKLVEEHFRFFQIGKQIVEEISPPLRAAQASSQWDKVRYFFYR